MIHSIPRIRFLIWTDEWRVRVWHERCHRFHGLPFHSSLNASVYMYNEGGRVSNAAAVDWKCAVLMVFPAVHQPTFWRHSYSIFSAIEILWSPFWYNVSFSWPECARGPPSENFIVLVRVYAWHRIRWQRSGRKQKWMMLFLFYSIRQSRHLSL